QRAIFQGVSTMRRGQPHHRNAGSIPVARLLSLAAGLFVCGGLLMFAKPRCIFAYYMACFYKRACSSEFWIEHTDVGRKCCQKSTKICYSIVFECCLAHRFRCGRAAAIRCSWIAILSSRE